MLGVGASVCAASAGILWPVRRHSVPSIPYDRHCGKGAGEGTATKKPRFSRLQITAWSLICLMQCRSWKINCK